MGKIYAGLFISLVILFVINATFIIINFYSWINSGIESLIIGENLIENIYYSGYLKWIVLIDLIWIASTLIFLFKRKHYKTDPKLHYLNDISVKNPNVCVIMPTYNEEKIIKKILNEFFDQEMVKQIIVVDNNSNDKTADIAEEEGAIVIRKKTNKGYAHSCMVGFKESLKTDADVITFVDADGTFSAKDIKKMVPYLENCDMVMGSRQVQVLTEKDNQNSMFYVWGNLFLAKLLQIKYFSLLHLGIVQLTDVGCSYRCMKREALEKIINDLTNPSDSAILHPNNWLYSIYVTMLAIENDLKIVEIPITFKKREGISKSEVTKKSKGISERRQFLKSRIRKISA